MPHASVTALDCVGAEAAEQATCEPRHAGQSSEKHREGSEKP